MSTVPQKLGKYELRQPLGRGNIGEVWKGYDHQYKRDVVVKVIHTDLQSDPNFMRRFTTEGQKIVSLRHDNIASVYDVAIAHEEQSTSTTAYIASAYIEGKTLDKHIATSHTKGALLSLPDIVYLFTSLGVAIDYAHQQGVIHGNIKPSNILLDQRYKEHFVLGEPMLTDFGLPLLLGATESVSTPHYMSPEQARGDMPNNRSDIYALGVILYELCTGTKPFRDESSVAVMMQHMNTLPTPPRLINTQLPPALSEVILRAMAKDTATRYPMASLLATAIADACSIRPDHHHATYSYRGGRKCLSRGEWSIQLFSWCFATDGSNKATETMFHRNQCPAFPQHLIERHLCQPPTCTTFLYPMFQKNSARLHPLLLQPRGRYQHHYQ